MKSSAPILRPKSSSISSSFEVRKITGRSVFWRMPAQQLHPVHARHLDVEDREIRRARRQPFQRRRAVGVGLDAIALGFECDRNRSQNVAVVVDKRDRCHFKRLPHERVSLPASEKGLLRDKLGTKCGTDLRPCHRRNIRAALSVVAIEPDVQQTATSPHAARPSASYKRFKRISKSLNRLMI